MKFALFVDGENDRKTVRILLENLFSGRSPKPAVQFRVLQRGDFFDARKVRAHLSALLSQHSDIGKAIFCLDSECTPADVTRQKLAEVERSVSGQYARLRLLFCLKVHALESWLATDRDALRRVLEEEPGQFPNPEAVCKPKVLMDNVFKRAGKDFLYTRDNPRIAKFADLATIKRSSPSFAEFLQAIEDP